MIQAVFFDWFNTLAHYHPPREELESHALRELGYTVSPRAVSQGLLLADRELYEESARLPLRQRSPEEQARIYARYQQTVLTEAGITPSQELIFKVLGRMRELYAGMRFVLFDDVMPTLKIVKERKLTVGLLTNLQSEINTICKELGIAPYIDFTVTSGEVGADKPRPPIFLRALELAKVKPAEAVHIGDQHAIDVAGAQGVGIVPILIDRADLYPEITDCPRIHSLKEVIGYLG